MSNNEQNEPNDPSPENDLLAQEQSHLDQESSSLVQSSSVAPPPRYRNYGSIESAPTPANRLQDHSDDDDQGSLESIPNERTPLTSPPSATSSGSVTPLDMKSTLSFLQKFGFGLGHVYNDLCAGVWFSYTLLFMQSVLGLPAVESGTLVMLGQVCDAIATPIVGVLADRYGTKRKWHIGGTALVFASFPMIFAICPWCDAGYTWWPPFYFSIFIVIFQVAWAIVQISHFAMIPELSKTTKDRADLTATRYSASVIANLVVYMTMWLILKGRSNDTSNIGPADVRRFRDIALILTVVGLSMSVVFHFSLALSDYERRRLMSLAAIREGNGDEVSSRKPGVIEDRKYGSDENVAAVDSERLIREIDDASHTSETHAQPRERRRQMRSFLKSPLLYQNAFLYVFARLFMTTSLLYMPLWLDERAYKAPGTAEQFADTSATVEHLATVPLMSFLASFVSSMLLKHTNQWLPHGMAYLLGSSISIAGCAWIALATPRTASTIQLFAIAVLFGSGSSITMVSSLCITADMIGNHTYQGGFIYSAVTFADKLITGIVVATIEAIKCRRRTDCPTYYQSVLAYGCGLAAILGVITLSTLRCTARMMRRRTRRNESI